MLINYRESFILSRVYFLLLKIRQMFPSMKFSGNCSYVTLSTCIFCYNHAELKRIVQNVNSRHEQTNQRENEADHILSKVSGLKGQIFPNPVRERFLPRKVG